MIWTAKHDKQLVHLARQGLSRAEMAAQLTIAFETPMTQTSVGSRLVKLRRQGVELPSLPMGSASTAHPSHPRTPEELRELTKVGADPRPSTSPASNDDELAERVVKLTRKKPLSFEAVCDALGLSPRRTREVIGLAQAQGYRIDVDGDHVGAPPPVAALDEQLITLEPAGPLHTIAAVGDIHFGSKHHMKVQFQDFCRIAYKRGVRQFLHVGDLLDGVYSHSVWEQSARGFEEQIAVAIRELPQWPDATWHFIQGNHDETLGMQSGLDVGRAIEQSFRAAGRNDLVYHGARGAYVRLKAPGEERGLLIELWHPGKGGAYAKSYLLQKKVEKYAPGTKPDVLLAGHWHQSLYVPIRGVHAISCGCWQGGQSSFGKSLGGAPDIGSWIIKYALTKGGTVRRFVQEWRAYYEVEMIRDIGLT